MHTLRLAHWFMTNMNSQFPCLSNGHIMLRKVNNVQTHHVVNAMPDILV